MWLCIEYVEVHIIGPNNNTVEEQTENELKCHCPSIDRTNLTLTNNLEVERRKVERKRHRPMPFGWSGITRTICSLPLPLWSESSSALEYEPRLPSKTCGAGTHLSGTAQSTLAWRHSSKESTLGVTRARDRSRECDDKMAGRACVWSERKQTRVRTLVPRY